MEEGYVLDRGHLNMAHPLTWIAGRWVPPTVKERLLGDPLRGKEPRPIIGYRCTGCGYLEAYAN